MEEGGREGEGIAIETHNNKEVGTQRSLEPKGGGVDYTRAAVLPIC